MQLVEDIMLLTQSPSEMNVLSLYFCLATELLSSSPVSLFPAPVMKVVERLLALSLEFQQKAVVASLSSLFGYSRALYGDFARTGLYRSLFRLVLHVPLATSQPILAIICFVCFQILTPDLVPTTSCPLFGKLMDLHAADILVAVIAQDISPEHSLLALTAIFAMHRNRSLPEFVRTAVPTYRDPLPFPATDRGALAGFAVCKQLPVL
jgi:hypothetical protein